MDNKKLISELQKRSGLDKSMINAIYKTMLQVISEQCINLNDVSIDNIGKFIPKKRLEFTHKDPETGNTLLYPPKISVKFSIDKTLIDKLNK